MRTVGNIGRCTLDVRETRWTLEARGGDLLLVVHTICMQPLVRNSNGVTLHCTHYKILLHTTSKACNVLVVLVVVVDTDSDTNAKRAAQQLPPIYFGISQVDKAAHIPRARERK